MLTRGDQPTCTKSTQLARLGLHRTLTWIAPSLKAAGLFMLHCNVLKWLLPPEQITDKHQPDDGAWLQGLLAILGTTTPVLFFGKHNPLCYWTHQGDMLPIPRHACDASTHTAPCRYNVTLWRSRSTPLCCVTFPFLSLYTTISFSFPSICLTRRPLFQRDTKNIHLLI